MFCDMKTKDYYFKALNLSDADDTKYKHDITTVNKLLIETAGE